MSRMAYLRVVLGIVMTVLIVSMGTDAMAQKKSAGGIIRLDETVIEGRVQKPNAFFINTRQGMVYEVMELRESFVEEIAKVVENGEF